MSEKKIPLPVKSIFFMLSYAFRELAEPQYKKLTANEYENFKEIYAAIIATAMSVQIKRGLSRDYVTKQEALPTIRGKIEISETIKVLHNILRKRTVCSYDDFSSNSYVNRIVKTTMLRLLHSGISKKRKKELKKVLVFLGDVEELDTHTINWRVQYNKTNQTYRMLIWICYLVINELLPEEREDSSAKEVDLPEERMLYKLYEQFVRNYYKKEFKSQINVAASKIEWGVDDGGSSELLPDMNSDITLSCNERVLIIDTKFYSEITKFYYGKESQHPANMYQIFTYVKNKQLVNENIPVAGMLLYALTQREQNKTEKKTKAERLYRLSGNEFSIKTLDLSCAPDKIAEQLNKIVEDFFQLKKNPDMVLRVQGN